MSKELAWEEGPEFHTVTTWKCEGCEKELVCTAKGAYEAGWDVPPYFGGHITCDGCPITVTAWYAALGGK